MVEFDKEFEKGEVYVLNAVEKLHNPYSPNFVLVLGFSHECRKHVILTDDGRVMHWHLHRMMREKLA